MNDTIDQVVNDDDVVTNTTTNNSDDQDGDVNVNVTIAGEKECGCNPCNPCGCGHRGHEHGAHSSVTVVKKNLTINYGGPNLPIGYYDHQGGGLGANVRAGRSGSGCCDDCEETDPELSDTQTEQVNDLIAAYASEMRIDNQSDMEHLALDTYTLTSATPLGVIGSSIITSQINVASNASGIEPFIEFAGGWRKTIDPGTSTLESNINLSFQYSLDGGAWTELEQNGDYNLLSRDTLGIDHEASVRRQILPTLSAGQHTVSVRVVVLENNLDPGVEFTNYRHTLRVEWPELDLPAT